MPPDIFPSARSVPRSDLGRPHQAGTRGMRTLRRICIGPHRRSRLRSPLQQSTTVGAHRLSRIGAAIPVRCSDAPRDKFRRRNVSRDAFRASGATPEETGFQRSRDRLKDILSNLLISSSASLLHDLRHSCCFTLHYPLPYLPGTCDPDHSPRCAGPVLVCASLSAQRDRCESEQGGGSVVGGITVRCTIRSTRASCYGASSRAPFSRTTFFDRPRRQGLDSCPASVHHPCQ